jgi:hypothetical protein
MAASFDEQTAPRVALDDESTVEVDLRSGWGTTGLLQYGGLIREEFLPELIGTQGMRVYREMGENDPTCSTILFLIDKLCRKVDWWVEPPSDRPDDHAAADFAWECFNDMEDTWTDTVSEFLSMLQYGHSLHSTIFKRRMGDLGPDADPARNSKHQDGRVGILGLPIRSQDTIFRWLFDERGRLLGAEQHAPPIYRPVILPMRRCLLFRTSKHKGNPLGRSIFRGAYRPWYLKRGIENIEAVGVERDLAGLPLAYLPPEICTPTTPKEKARAAEWKKILTNVRVDAQAALMIPSAFDDKGNRLIDFKLLTAGGGKQFDTDKIIQRYDRLIATTAIADFVFLGQGASGSGSWAMHTDKTELFGQAVDVFLDIICETINRQLMPTLFRMNRFAITDLPQLKHESVVKQDLKDLGAYVQALSAAGMPLFPNPVLEKFLMRKGDMPEPLDTSVGASIPALGVDPGGIPSPGPLQPQPDEAPLSPLAAGRPVNEHELHDEPTTPQGVAANDPEAAKRAQEVFSSGKLLG